MNAIRELTAVLISAGMDPVDAATLVARAGAEFVPQKSAGAVRQQRWRDRNKASQSVTNETPDEASQSVTNRNEAYRRNGAIYKEVSKKERKESKKRGSQIRNGWRPESAHWSGAIAKLGSVTRAEAELRKFTNHALSKGRVCKNWNAAWDNWVDQSLEWSGNNGYRPANQQPTGHNAILAAATRKARELVGDGPMAGTADEDEFSFGSGINGTGTPMDRRQDQGAARTDGGREGIIEGEVIPPDKASGGIPNGQKR